jgi:hypothetical protein
MVVSELEVGQGLKGRKQEVGSKEIKQEKKYTERK